MGVFVLPHANHVPAGGLEEAVDPPIPLDIRRELGRPPRPIVRGDGCVLRAAVPETTVDEDSDLRWPENDVGSASQVGQRGLVDSKSKTSSMQRRPQLDLWLGVSSPLSSESCSGVLVERFDHDPAPTTQMRAGGDQGVSPPRTESPAT